MEVNDIKYSVIVPVYKNEESIDRLIQALHAINESLEGTMEAVLVVDGSPDNSFSLIKNHIDLASFPIKLIAHSRNFGSFAAIRTGLIAASGDIFAVMAADLQEPPELISKFFNSLNKNECDVTIGNRVARDDSLFSSFASKSFWYLYKKFVVPEMPAGGVDVFGCNKAFRDQLIQLEEAHSSLVALIFWLGFERKEFDYVRQKRLEGKSAWTFKKKINYMMDSVFAFTNLPIRLLTTLGMVGIISSIILAIAILIARFTGSIETIGYSANMLTILGLGSLNLLGIGVVGNYAWRAYENSKNRPHAVISITCESKHYGK